MISFRCICCGVIVGAAAAGASHAACPGNVAVVSSVTITNATAFDPFSGDESRKAGVVSIKNNDAAECTSVRLTFIDPTDEALLLSGGNSIPFKITTTGTYTQMIGNVNGILVGTILPGATANVAIDFLIEAPVSGTAPAPGNPYIDNDISLVVSSVDASPNVLDQGKILTVQASVDTLLDINIDATAYLSSGTFAAYTMDLGTLSNSSTGSVGVTVRSNVNHRVVVTSENSGMMVGPAPPAVTTHQVPYTMTFGGSAVTLGQPLSQGGATDVGGAAKTFAVDITDIGSAKAGSYKDTITLTVEAGL